jgi:hypothetical protein
MRYRVAAALASVAFVVALAAGLAGGVRFGTVLLRAIAGGAVFAALGAVAAAVLERYVPDLASRPAEGRASEPTDEAGADTPRIDIVLPEENPLEDAIASDLEPADAEAVEPVEGPEAAPPGPLEGTGEPAGRALAVEELAAEPTGDGGDADGEALPSLDGPDIQPMEPPAGAPPGGTGPSGAAGRGGAGVDPSQAARALKTWLKRDHEG